MSTADGSTATGSTDAGGVGEAAGDGAIATTGPDVDTAAPDSRVIAEVPGTEPGETGTATEETPDAEAEPLESPVPAAELIVAEIRWRLDIGTLREVVDDQETLRDVAERLDALVGTAMDNVSRARLLSLRSEVQRLLGDLDRAAADSRLALAHGQAGGDAQAVALARSELAQVLRLRGEFAEADRLFQEVIAADVPDQIRCVAHENAGRAGVDQGRYLEACDHFGRAMRLGDPEDLDLIARLELMLDAIYIRVLRDGWGPSPRRRTEIMSTGRLPVAPQA